MPSSAAIGTPPTSSSSQVPTPSTAMPIRRPAISRRITKPIRSPVRKKRSRLSLGSIQATPR